LILGLLMALATIPMSASEGACDMEMEALSGGCSCCDDEGRPSSEPSSCATRSASTVSCCESMPLSPSAQSFPATRSTGSEILPVLIGSYLLVVDRPVIEPSIHVEGIPDVVAAERQHTYLHVSSFLI
jgi:hypothetical protein